MSRPTQFVVEARWITDNVEPNVRDHIRSLGVDRVWSRIRSTGWVMVMMRVDLEGKR